jgi:hypothetical protein
MTQAQSYAEKDVSISKKHLLSHLGNIVQWNKIRRLDSAFRQPLVVLSKIGAVRITLKISGGSRMARRHRLDSSPLNLDVRRHLRQHVQ